MNGMVDATSYSTPWDIEDDPLYQEEEEDYDEEYWDIVKSEQE